MVLEEHATLMPRINHVFDSQMFAKNDLGAAVYGLTLAAAAQGIGSCIIGTFDRPRLSDLLGLPLWQPQHMLVALGYPAEAGIRKKQRKPLQDLVCYL